MNDLDNWAALRKHLYATGKLSPHEIKELGGIDGWTWELWPDEEEYLASLGSGVNKFARATPLPNLLPILVKSTPLNERVIPQASSHESGGTQTSMIQVSTVETSQSAILPSALLPVPSNAPPRPTQLLASPTLFTDLLDILKRSGLVDEERNALVTYITATSRLLAKPISLFVKGPSGSGKNFLVDHVLSLFPESAYHKYGSAADKSWNYAENAFEHKVLYLAERNPSSGSVHPSRLLISEGKLTHFATDFINGKRTNVAHVANGPIAAITTTTKNELAVDDETRQLSVWVDASAEQTLRINQAEVLRSKLSPVPRLELAAWCDLQSMLRDQYLGKTLRVSSDLPEWLATVAEYFPSEHPHSRRYWRSFLGGCYTIALLRQARKESRNGLVWVDFADVAIAIILFGSVIGESLQHHGDKIHATAYAIAGMQATTGEPVTIQELASALQISYQRAAALIREAETAGAVKRAKVGARNLKYYSAVVKRPQALPSPEELYDRLGLDVPVEFRHPLTGESVMLKKTKN